MEKSSQSKDPLVIIVIGMAGSGKSSFVKKLLEELGQSSRVSDPSRVYAINMDPAVLATNFTPKIDIRDSVDYRKVMKNYKLGPNGAILTCLNLFAAQFDQAMKILEEKKSTIDYIIVDTPG